MDDIGRFLLLLFELVWYCQSHVQAEFYISLFLLLFFLFFFGWVIKFLCFKCYESSWSYLFLHLNEGVF